MNIELLVKRRESVKEGKKKDKEREKFIRCFLSQHMTGFITIKSKCSADAGRWGITFLVADSRMLKKEWRYLMRQATEMYSYNESKRNLETDSFEGKPWTEGKCAVFGFFGGRQYDALLDMDKNRGRVKVRFLVSEQTGRERGMNYN